MTSFNLSARSMTDARREIRRRWPDKEVKFEGFYNDECVVMSLVRKRGDSSNVATTVRNRSPKANRFVAHVPSI